MSFAVICGRRGGVIAIFSSKPDADRAKEKLEKNPHYYCLMLNVKEIVSLAHSKKRQDEESEVAEKERRAA